MADIPTHNPYSKWYPTIPLYTHSLPLNLVENIFSFKGAWKISKPKSSFLIFFQKFLQKWTEDFLSKGQKPQGGRTEPLPHGLEG